MAGFRAPGGGVQSREGRCVFSSFRPAKTVFRLSWLRQAGARSLALLFPADCALCGVELLTAGPIPLCDACLEPPEPFLPEYCCARCRAVFLNPAPLDQHGLCALCRLGATAYDQCWSYGLHDGRLRQLIHLFKYSPYMRPLAAVFGRWLDLAYPRTDRFDALVPMPLHWWKRLRRGFNQSELLARELSRRTGVPVRRVLRRRRATAAQAGLTHAQRRDNVRNAFEVPHPAAVRGLSLLLIDDVLTTGSTVNACARALKRAGAVRVSVLTLSRAGRQPDPRILSASPIGWATGVTA